MANLKTGLDYIPLSLDFFDDDKIALIEAEFGAKGSYIAIRLLVKLYRFGYYLQWGDDELLLFTNSLPSKTGFSPDFVQRVVTRLVDRGLFDSQMFHQFCILTSRGIQRRYFGAVRRRKALNLEKKCLLIDPTSLYNVNISPDNVNTIAQNADILKQSTAQQSKVKQSKAELPPLSPPSMGGESEERGGELSQSFYDIKGKLAGIAGVSEKDISECMRLTQEGKADSFGVSLIKQWLEMTPRERIAHPFYTVVQQLQRLEDDGTIQATPRQEYYLRPFLMKNMPLDEYVVVAKMIQDPALLKECISLANEVRKGGINLPGKFIISRLRKAQQLNNRQHIRE